MSILPGQLYKKKEDGARYLLGSSNDEETIVPFFVSFRFFPVAPVHTVSECPSLIRNMGAILRLGAREIDMGIDRTPTDIHVNSPTEQPMTLGALESLGKSRPPPSTQCLFPFPLLPVPCFAAVPLLRL